MNADLAMRFFHGGKRLPHFTSSEPDVLVGSVLTRVTLPDRGGFRPLQSLAASTRGVIGWKNQAKRSGASASLITMADVPERSFSTARV